MNDFDTWAAELANETLPAETEAPRKTFPCG